MTRLEGSKWTSTRPRLGWRHFVFVQIEGKGREASVTLAAVVDRTVRLVVPLGELLNPEEFRTGWQTLPREEAD